MSLFGSSGIRDKVDRRLLELTFEVGLALGGSYSTVVVGCDTRTSSPAMKHALISGLLAAGARAYDAGVVPTPTLAFISRKFGAGAMITASHNPPEYNGIKLWNPDGSAFDSRQRRQIEERESGKASSAAPWQGMQGCQVYPGAVEEHCGRILREFSAGLGLRVVVDCGGGAASQVTPQLLRRMGCEVEEVNCQPSGHFPRGAEPTPENLSTLQEAARSISADLGIAHDGDGDRMVALDEQGRFVPGDKLMALFARQLGVKRVVTTLDASIAIEELGVEVVRTRVGDAYVSEELKGRGEFAPGQKKGEAVRGGVETGGEFEIGGEPSGAWIFPGISYCPDGIYAAALIAHIASKERLSRLVDDLPSYPVLRGSLSGGKEMMAGLEERLRDLAPLSMSRIDGLRFTFADGWLLIRASGTEPKIRLTAEARSQDRAEELYRRGLEALRGCRR